MRFKQLKLLYVGVFVLVIGVVVGMGVWWINKDEEQNKEINISLKQIENSYENYLYSPNFNLAFDSNFESLATGNNYSEQNTYENKEHNYQIHYPNNWQQIDNKQVASGDFGLIISLSSVKLPESIDSKNYIANHISSSTNNGKIGKYMVWIEQFEDEGGYRIKEFVEFTQDTIIQFDASVQVNIYLTENNDISSIIKDRKNLLQQTVNQMIESLKPLDMS